jgi:S1-C subfamily serine protease
MTVRHRRSFFFGVVVIAAVCLSVVMMAHRPAAFGQSRPDKTDALRADGLKTDAPKVSADVARTLCHAMECPWCVVAIRVEPGGGVLRYGTGVLLEDGRVLTAAHVTDGAKPATVHVLFGGRGDRPEFDATSPHATQIKENDVEDFAVITGLTIPDWALGVKIAAKEPKLGEVLTSIGLEATDAVRLHCGKMLGRDFAGTKLCVGVLAQQGDSGGPVFNADGELVGINNAIGGLVQTTIKTYAVGGGAVVIKERVVPATYVVDLFRVKIDQPTAATRP